MKKLLLPIIAALVLFATSASANHTVYLSGNSYRDSGLATCSTMEASLKVIDGMTNFKYLTYSVGRKIAETNNCRFYRNPVMITVGDLLCKSTRSYDGKTFTIAKVTIEYDTEEQFTVLYTNSDTFDCDGYVMNKGTTNETLQLYPNRRHDDFGTRLNHANSVRVTNRGYTGTTHPRSR